ncbi:protein argonaute 16 [Sesamum angolense]|uniref:Protein argonaute 16 n=1 Tax=Sesamum angolense TaxID=2727404 RepID=A0AAE1WQK1_9LAMI|nr:protein argonaute 16 [Sesamum angolense]
MEKAGRERDKSPSLAPPASTILHDVKVERVDLPKRSIITRPGFGTSGQRISLLVSISSENNSVVDSKVIGRKVTEKLYQTYSSELSGKKFAYDGEKNLYTVGPLPHNNFEFTVVLEESIAKRGSPSHSGSPNNSSKKSKRSLQSNTFKVEISYAAKIPLKTISLALQGVRGFHSSFRPTHGGLSLNMDVSTTMILKPGPVLDFLLANQNVKETRYIDWVKAKKMLKNLRVKAIHSNMEFKIIGLSDKPCNQQFFSLKVKSGSGSKDEGETLEITVYDYFVKHRNIDLKYSAYMPCLDVGKPKRPNYLPLELCSLVSLQRYTKALSVTQRASLVEKSRQKPPERIRVITDAVSNYRYDEDPLLVACGISIEKQLTQIDGRVLDAPKLKVGNSEDCIPRNGRWNFNNKLGGTNSLLAIEHSRRIPLITDKPTMILGMDVSHGSPGRSDIPSIAAVVGSRSWPLISRYRAAVRTQSPKVEMIESLFKPLANGEDDGIMRELLVDFYETSNGRKPTQIIVFRDGVSESQFAQVMNIELDQMIKAYQHLGETDIPKFTLIVAQKNHHTKLFQASAAENVPSDDLQNLIHSLSYVYQRSTTAISIVAPVCYAHLAAQQMGQFLKFEDSSETSSGQKSMTAAGNVPVPELPRLHKDVAGSMFFC